MGFRTVVVTTHSKLEYSLNYLVYRTTDEVKRINIGEIQTLIIESTAVSITSALLNELIKQKIKVIFCDEKKNPSCELMSYYGDVISSKRINEQINWHYDTKQYVWKLIIEEKIKKQAEVMKLVPKEDSILISNFSFDVLPGDTSNREGHAAKMYFNRVFGNDFTRNGNNPINVYLNYGYSLILSQFNKYIVSKGYLTQLGIHHKSEFNQFNLSCDLMEPFRAIVDRKALYLNDDNFKDELIKMLSDIVIIAEQKQTISNAIGIYCNSIFSALNTGDVTKIKFYSFYE